MRRNGVLGSAAGLVPFGHVGWGFRERSEFLCRAAEYLADGLDCGQRVAYVGEADPDVLRAELAAVRGLAEHPGFDDIDVHSAWSYYPFHAGTDVVDATAAVSRYLEVAERAVADGHTGFRAVVDVTPVVRTAAQRDELATLEHLVDRHMAVAPFSALCAYDLTELGDHAAELICLHPFVAHDTTDFRLFADPVAEVDCALRGEVDAASMRTFDATLRRIWPPADRREFLIDARGLEFIGQRQLRLLDEFARERGQSVLLRTDRPIPARLVEVLRLDHVRVQRCG